MMKYSIEEKEKYNMEILHGDKKLVNLAIKSNSLVVDFSQNWSTLSNRNKQEKPSIPEKCSIKNCSFSLHFLRSLFAW